MIVFAFEIVLYVAELVLSVSHRTLILISVTTLTVHKQTAANLLVVCCKFVLTWLNQGFMLENGEQVLASWQSDRQCTTSANFNYGVCYTGSGKWLSYCSLEGQQESQLFLSDQLAVSKRFVFMCEVHKFYYLHSA